MAGLAAADAGRNLQMNPFQPLELLFGGRLSAPTSL
jgi:hypothetical protein